MDETAFAIFVGLPSFFLEVERLPFSGFEKGLEVFVQGEQQNRNLAKAQRILGPTNFFHFFLPRPVRPLAFEKRLSLSVRFPAILLS